MTEMTGEVLEYCRGRMEVRPEPVALRVFLGKVARAVHAEMIARSIQVLVGIREDTVVRLDSTRMERVFRNLLRNAADAMPDGGEIRLGAARSGDRLIISVADTGCGMSEDVLRRATEPFFSSGKELGSGLGMAIAGRIVEGHGGALEIESVQGKGTTVRVLLPLEAPGATMEPAEASEPQTQAC